MHPLLQCIPFKSIVALMICEAVSALRAVRRPQAQATADNAGGNAVGVASQGRSDKAVG